MFSIGDISSRGVSKVDDPYTPKLLFPMEIGIEKRDSKVVICCEDSFETEPAPRFGIWEPVKGLLVCSELEGDGTGKRQVALLINILLATGVQVDGLGDMEIIEWPRLKANRASQAEIMDFFATVMATRAELAKTMRIIMFGDAAKRWFLNAEQIASIRLGRCEVYKGVVVALLPALKNMLEQPQSKRDAWDILRPRPCLGKDAFNVPAT